MAWRDFINNHELTTYSLPVHDTRNRRAPSGSAVRPGGRRRPGHARVRQPVRPVGRPVASRRREGRGRIDRDRHERTPAGNDRERLRAVLAEKAAATSKATATPSAAREPLWIVLIGHGTSDGREAKFNLRGPDVTDLELAEWLAPIKRPVAVLDCTSASGPFLNRLSGAGPGRRHRGQERARAELRPVRPVPRRGDRRPRADLDKDGQVSLLEAFLTASSRVNEYYRTHSQLATEHALLDDNGDKLGTPADWFRGVRATRRAKDGAALDGLRAHQLHLIPSDRERDIPPAVRQRRNELELSVAALRDEKTKLGADEYYKRLEPLMVELARLYRDSAGERSQPRDNDTLIRVLSSPAFGRGDSPRGAHDSVPAPNRWCRGRLRQPRGNDPGKGRGPILHDAITRASWRCAIKTSRTRLPTADEVKRASVSEGGLLALLTAAAPDDAAKMKAVDEFIAFAPKDERGAELLTMLSRMPSFRPRRSYKALKALYQRIGDQYPGSRSAELRRGSLRRLDAVGKPFDLEFIEAISGSQVSMKDLRGKAVVIDFWSTSCSACVAEMPKMKKLYAEFKEKGLEIIGVNLDAPKEDGGLDKLKEFVKKEGIPWPQYYQGDGWHSAFSTSWGIHFLPAVFVVDQEGKLYSVEARGKLETMIPKLLNRPAPKADESRR